MIDPNPIYTQLLAERRPFDEPTELEQETADGGPGQHDES
jgi:hypothetical protein